MTDLFSFSDSMDVARVLQDLLANIVPRFVRNGNMVRDVKYNVHASKSIHLDVVMSMDLVSANLVTKESLVNGYVFFYVIG